MRIFFVVLQIRNTERYQTRGSRLPEGWTRRLPPDLSRPRCRVVRGPRRFRGQHRLHFRRERLPAGRLSSAHFAADPRGDPRVPQAVGIPAQHARTYLPIRELPYRCRRSSPYYTSFVYSLPSSSPSPYSSQLPCKTSIVLVFLIFTYFKFFNYYLLFRICSLLPSIYYVPNIFCSYHLFTMYLIRYVYPYKWMCWKYMYTAFLLYFAFIFENKLNKARDALDLLNFQVFIWT